MAYPRLNAQTMADNWAKGMNGAGANWTAGINAPRNNPNADPAKNTANWQAGVANAGPRFNAGISSPDFMVKWQNGAKNKVASFTGAGNASKATYTTAAGKVANMITQSLANLPAKGPAGTNTGRSTAFQEAMHALKGQGRAR